MSEPSLRLCATPKGLLRLLDSLFAPLRNAGSTWAKIAPGTPRFFREGVGQMDALDYPAPVRRLMQG